MFRKGAGPVCVSVCTSLYVVLCNTLVIVIP